MSPSIPYNSGLFESQDSEYPGISGMSLGVPYDGRFLESRNTMYPGIPGMSLGVLYDSGFWNTFLGCPLVSHMMEGSLSPGILS